MKKLKLLYAYYFLIIVMSIIATIILPKPIKNYIPIILFVNYIILFFISFYKNFKLSQIIKYKHNEFFEKYKFNNEFSLISGKIISVFSYFRNLDIEIFENEIKQEYIFIKNLILLSYLSVLIGILLAIYTIYT